jgi:hypothetical protein
MKKGHSTLHSVIFNKAEWTLKKANDWLNRYEIKPIKLVDKTLNYLRFRVRDPKEFKNFFTKDLGNGVKIVLGTK